MPRVFIPAPLRSLAGGRTSVELPGSNVRQLVAALDQQFPGMAARLTENDNVSRGLMVSVDGSVAPLGLLAPVSPTSEVHFLPAIGGG